MKDGGNFCYTPNCAESEGPETFGQLNRSKEKWNEHTTDFLVDPPVPVGVFDSTDVS
jgi:hypothetical protein